MKETHGLIQFLEGSAACYTAAVVVQRHGSAQEAWEKCTRADWMGWYLHRVNLSEKNALAARDAAIHLCQGALRKEKVKAKLTKAELKELKVILNIIQKCWGEDEEMRKVTARASSVYLHTHYPADAVAVAIRSIARGSLYLVEERPYYFGRAIETMGDVVQTVGTARDVERQAETVRQFLPKIPRWPRQ